MRPTGSCQLAGPEAMRVTRSSPRGATAPRPCRRSSGWRSQLFSERGAAMLETSISFIALMMFFFAGLEYSMATRTSEAGRYIAVSGVRVAAANGRNPQFYNLVVADANDNATAFPNGSPQDMWIYRSGPNGNPMSSNSTESSSSEPTIGGCVDCTRYVWSSGQWVLGWSPNGSDPGWDPDDMYTCVPTVGNLTPIDVVTIRVTASYEQITGIVPAVPSSYTRSSSMALEPRPTGQCS